MILKYIIIGEYATESLKYVDKVEAIQGRGLKGDRYYYKRGTFNKPQLDQTKREVTIIPYETLLECNNRINSNLDFLDLRRNLVVENFDYEKLKDKEFTIGEVTFKIVRTAPPCKYLSKLLGEDMLSALKYIGGYRADIVKSGLVCVDDEVKVI